VPPHRAHNIIFFGRLTLIPASANRGVGICGVETKANRAGIPPSGPITQGDVGFRSVPPTAGLAIWAATRIGGSSSASDEVGGSMRGCQADSFSSRMGIPVATAPGRPSEVCNSSQLPRCVRLAALGRHAKPQAPPLERAVRCASFGLESVQAALASGFEIAAPAGNSARLSPHAQRSCRHDRSCPFMALALASYPRVFLPTVITVDPPRKPPGI
jgi:hypothetical protein